MKNKKLFGLLVIILVATLALTACDGTIPEGLDMAQFTGQTTNSSQDFQAELAKNSSSSLDDASGKEHGQELKITGEVSELTANTITINGETFTVMSAADLTTLFSLGGIFEIEFYLNEDGTITLKDFHLDDSLDGSSSESEHGPEIKFKGEVTGVTPDTITFNGQTFTVMTGEDLTTLFIAGEFYEIEYYLNSDGTITLKGSHLEDSLDDSSSQSEHGLEIKFKGEVTEVTPDTITINSETFTVVTDEDLTTLFTAGEFYEIEYYLNSDGTITLKEYHLEDNFSSSSDDDMDDDSDDDMDDDSNNNNDDDYDDNNNNEDEDEVNNN